VAPIGRFCILACRLRLMSVSPCAEAVVELALHTQPTKNRISSLFISLVIMF